MAGWAGSDRKETLPANWESLRQAVFRRDGNRCVIIKRDGRRCWDRDVECDHIGDRNDHRMENLQSVCSWHHLRKSGSQGGKASAAARKKRRDEYRRQPEVHPGLIQHQIKRKR